MVAHVSHCDQWVRMEGVVALRNGILVVSTLIASSIVGASCGSAQNVDINRLIGAFVGGAFQGPGADLDRRRPNPYRRESEPAPRPEPRQIGGGGVYPYSVAGLKLGDSLQSLNQYSCEPSIIIDQAFWCQKTGRSTSANGDAVVADKVLVSDRQGVRYASRYVDPAYFQPGEVLDEVARLRARFRDQGHLNVYGQNGRNPSAVIATWGDIILQQLTSADISAIRSNTFKAKGLYIDYLNDPSLSAQRGMPVYQISGGPGFFWISKSDDNGVGSLRFGMIDVNYGGKPSESPSQVAAGPNEFSGRPGVGQQITPFAGARISSTPPPSDFAAAAPQSVAQMTSSAAVKASAPPPPSDFATQPGASAAVSIASKDASTPAAASDAVKTVDVTGYGETVDAARSDAARQAVQQVAGVYVDNRRRVDENVTDQKVSTVVNEKVLSYTNAYVTHLDVTDVANSNGLFSVRAHISVAIAPLVKTLNDNRIPTVAFDSNSAVATVITATAEKTDAQKLYSDLISRVSNLITVSVGTPKPLPDLPASTDHVWLQIPVTYFANKDAISEWRKKMSMIAQSTSQVDVFKNVVRPMAMANCSLPDISADRTLEGAKESDLDRRNIPGSFGVEVCFADSDNPSGLSSTCYRRDFSYSLGNPTQCRTDATCPSLIGKEGSIRTNVEFLDKDGSVVYSVPIAFSSFPQISTWRSRDKPEDIKNLSFINFCVGRHDLFYSYTQSSMNHPELIIMPLPGSRIDSYFDVQVPIEKIASIASVRAQVVTR